MEGAIPEAMLDECTNRRQELIGRTSTGTNIQHHSTFVYVIYVKSQSEFWVTVDDFKVV